TNVIMSGLIQMRLASNHPQIAPDIAAVAEKLGPDFKISSDRLWSLPASAPEWSVVRSSLLSRMIVSVTALRAGNERLDAARKLAAAVESARKRESGDLECLAGLQGFRADDAARGMIVDQAHGLHERVHGRWADEAPAKLLEVLRYFDRLFRDRHGLALRARLVAPDVGRQRAFALHHLLRAARVVDDGLDLAAMAHDARVAQQALDVTCIESGHLVEIEILERGTKV